MMKKIWAVFLGLSVVVGTARADLYDVTSIPVVAERASVQEAREAAIQEGQTEAFWMLIKKMVAPDDVARISLPPEETVVDMVQNVSVANEKMTATKYMANLSVRFHPDKIQGFLTERQIPFLVQELPSTVVIPMLRRGEETLILEENNPLYAFMRTHALAHPLCEVTVPVGDLEEIALARQIWMSGDLSSMQVFAERYHVDRVLILLVEQSGPYVTAKAVSLPPLPDETLVQPAEAVAPSGQIDTVLEDIWKQTMRGQIQAWLAVRMNNLTPPDVIWIRVPVQNLGAWVQMQRKLKKIPAMETLEVRGFRPNEVLVTVSTTKTVYDLKTQLRPLKLWLETTGVADTLLLRSQTVYERGNP